ncbi:hypothetical protein VTK26DRAFT_9484 [Humicola hyalothermophila]
MAKGKSGGGGGVQNRAIYSRMSFLQQAAMALSSIPQCIPESSNAVAVKSPPPPSQPSLEGLSRRLATDLRAVSLKTRIRLSPAVKQTICKFCDSPLIEGESCTSHIDNRSKGGRKPWADVLVRKCHTCGGEKRYPVNSPRPKRKTERCPGEAFVHPQKQKQKD